MGNLTERDRDFLAHVGDILDSSSIIKEEKLSQITFELLMHFYKSVKSSEDTKNALLDAFFANADTYSPLVFHISKHGYQYEVAYEAHSNDGIGRQFDNRASGNHSASAENVASSISASVIKTNLLNSADVKIGSIVINNGYMGILRGENAPSIQYAINAEDPIQNTYEAAENVRKLFGELASPPPKLLGMG